jgi:hypothetical protein
MSFFEDFRNTSNYDSKKRPPVPVTPLEPLDKGFLRESTKELTMILSKEWTNEVERSSEIQIRMTSSVIQCKIHGIMVDVLYNPTVGANIMSASFVATYFDN